MPPQDTYSLGQAPWEIAPSGVGSGQVGVPQKPAESYPLGQAPWEMGGATKGTSPAIPKQQEPSFGEAFISPKPQEGFIGSTIQGTIGGLGVLGAGGAPGRAISSFFATEAIPALAESKGQLADITTQLIRHANSFPPGDIRRTNLLSQAQENQKTMGISDEEMKNLTGMETKIPQLLGTGIRAGATLAGGAINPATLGSKMLLSTGLGAAYGGAQKLDENAHPGEILKGALAGGAIGAATQGVMSGISSLSKYMTQQFPTRLTRDLLGQSPKEIMGGKDASKFLLSDKRVGTFEGLIGRGNSNIEDLGSQVSDILQKASGKGKTISPTNIAQEVADTINSQGGQITATEVLDTIKQLAPQVKGWVNNKVNDLTTTNALRQGLDQTLGDKGFLTSQLPFNKYVLREFANASRNAVKSAAPETKTLFSEMSKEINLRDALLEQSAKISKQPILKFRDLIGMSLGTGVGSILGGLGGGLPGAAAGIAVERGLQSAPAMTGMAVGLNQAGRLAPYLSKLTPAARIFLLDSLAGDTSKQ